MSPENTIPTQEKEEPYEINTGDVVFASRNLRDEKGEYLLDQDGKRETVLEDGWEVVDTNATNPANNREGVLLRNTNNEEEFKFYSVAQLKALQAQAEEDIMSRAADSASAILGEIDEKSQEIADHEPIGRQEAEKIGEEVVEVVEREAEGSVLPKGSMAEVMSGQTPGMKFDIEAALERQRQEKEQALVPEKELQEVQATMQEVLRQFDIAMHEPDQNYVRQLRNQLETNLVIEFRRAAEKSERGADQHAIALEQGFLIGSARTHDAFSEMASKLVASSLFKEEDLQALRSTLGDISAHLSRGEAEGYIVGGLASNVDAISDRVLARNNNQLTPGYAVLSGMLAGLTGRIGPEAQGFAQQRVTDAVERIGHFKKPEA